MNPFFIGRQQGFTLVEVLVVLMVIVALSSITLEMTSEFAFQNRFNITKDRYQKIKTAIIGNPDLVVNGQPDIKGFVADLGRPPDVLRELLQQFSCSDTSKKRPRDCVSPATMSWADATNYVEDGPTGLKYGWNGPYLSSPKSATDQGALGDGWGNKSPSNDDPWDEATWVNQSPNNNYGWVVSTFTNLGDDFKVKSKGKDQIVNADGCLEYEDDCEYSIKGNEYSIADPSISVLINTFDESTYTDDGSCSLGSCSNPTYLNPQDCSDNGGTWTSTHTDKQSCMDNGGDWTALISSTVQPTQGVCMQVFFRNGGSIASLSSDNGSNPAVIKDGTQQAANFDFTGDIPIGINAIGIYEYDGANCGPNLYPLWREIKHIVFAPNKSLDGLVW